MKNIYCPDKWVVLRLKAGKLDSGIYKVLGGWSGGYLDGDSWRLNSGIERVTIDGDYFEFHGYSGSVYRCHKGAYGFNMISGGQYHSWKKQEGFTDQVYLMLDDTDWEALFND